jgi:hypothetical protein
LLVRNEGAEQRRMCAFPSHAGAASTAPEPKC